MGRNLRDLDSKIWELGQIWENFLEMVIAHNASVAGAINSKMRARGTVARTGGGVVRMWSCSLCEASNRGTVRNCRQCHTLRVEREVRLSCPAAIDERVNVGDERAHAVHGAQRLG